MRRFTLSTFIVVSLVCATPILRAQLVADGATNTLSNVTNTITGSVTVGTNGAFTLLVLSDNALLTNSAHGVIGRNATALSNEVQLLSASARWIAGNNLFVGSNGAFNRLVVSNGAFLNNNSGFLGNGASSSNNFALITGSGSFWTNRSDLRVGVSGRDNQMIISNGARVISFGGELGSQPGSSNNLVVVTGTGSVWTNVLGGWVSIGGGERGNRLIIEAGGQVGGDNGVVGAGFFGGDSEALVTGSGSLWSSRADAVVGLNPSNNRLVVSNGAAVVAGNNGRLGAVTGSTNNVVVVTGAGSLWSNRFELYVGEGGPRNRMEVNNGGWVVSSNTYVGLARSNNLALITGAGSTLSNRASLFVGAGGSGNQLIVSNGASVMAAVDSFLGHDPGASNNVALVTGAGSLWTHGGDLYVGYQEGRNQLVVSNGAVVADRIGYLGYFSIANNNTALVTGAGSVWSNRFNLNVGLDGTGNRLLVNNGGRVFVNGIGRIGASSGASNNSITVAMPGSGLTVGGDFYAGSNCAFNVMQLATGASASIGGKTYVGFGGNGNNNTLAVSDANSLWTSQDDFLIGGGSGRDLLLVVNGGVARGLADGWVGMGGPLNEVIISDPGSLWDLSAGTLFVGLTDSGNQVTVSDSGMIRSAAGQLGLFPFGSNALVTVTGAGALWQLTGSLIVGLNGPGHRLAINNGGAVETSNGVFVGLTTNSTRNRVTVDGGVLRATNGAFGGLLDVRRGTNVLNAGLIEVDLLLLTNAQGFFEFNGGTLITRRSSISNGTPFVVGRGGSVPAIWDVRAGGSHALAGRLTVGSNASFNQVFITNGATLTGGEYTFLALTAGSNNAVTVSGPGSTLNSPSGFFVGADGNANRMLISDGGKAIASVGSAGTFIGRSVGTRSNAVTVAGPGSRWSINDTLYVGSGGHGNQMVISNGAAVDSLNGYVGNATSGSNNLALVTGANSSWSNRSDFYVGAGGSGNRLIVTGGGTVIHSNAFLGLNSSSLNNTVEVSGGGSRWSSHTDLTVGYDGSGNQVAVNGGAAVSVGSRLLIGLNFPIAANNRVTVDGGSLLVTNPAATGLLEIRRGTNVLNLGLVEVDILRMTNGSGGRFEFNGGTLSVKSSRVSIGPPLIVGNGVNPATLNLAGNGTHDFTGTLGLILTNNAILTGNGTVIAQLQVRPGSQLVPGVSVGKISLTPPPILSGGTVVMELSKDGAVVTNDQIQVTGTVTYGGSLTVTHLGPGALAAGDKFRLFNATAYAGSFTSLTLPPLSPSLFWKTNLLTDGSLEVSAPPAIALSSGSYTQRFDALASTGVNQEWRDNSTLLGWYAAQSLSPFAITDYLVSDGSFNNGGLYGFGATGGVDRALGSIASNSRGTISYGLGFLNDTPDPARAFTLTWTGEQWRGSESGTSNTLTFWYRVSSVALTSPEPGVFTNWTEVTNLNFTSPTVPVGATPLDGNQATNRRVFTAVTISGLEVPPGQSVFFRWHDVNDGGSDHGLAVDDLTVSFSGPASNAPIHLIGQVLPGTGAFQINFTNLPGAAFTVLASDDLSLKLTNWTVLGAPTEIAPGEFRFTDPITNQPRRYYIIRAP